VIWAGVVGSYPDLFTRWRRSGGPTPTPGSSTRRRWRSDWTSRYGTPEENPEFWDTVSSNSYLGDISGPVQLHHGEADASVPLVFSEILYQQLQEVGKAVELYAYPEDNHNLSNSFSTAMRRTIEFFDRYLKGE
jgi:dipeptidyl aminopeptidase/acylaminoacyl peptidase